MINSTLNYYEENAQQFIQDTLNKDMDVQYAIFEKYIQDGSHILDAGCGSGRDSLYFKSRGYRCTAFDISKKMCDFASKILDQEVLQLSFEDLDFEDEFDAIWASASLLHIPKDKMLSSMKRLSLALKSEGVIYTSFKLGEREFIKGKRFFNSYTKESFQELIDLTSFQMLESFVLEDSRPDKKGEYWLNCICINDK
ncbi:class I SAM-dependent methyltransferase [Campylobacterota bacterium]